MTVPGIVAASSRRALPASCAAALAAAVCVTPAAAQDECAGKASAAEEIACLREALEQSRRTQLDERIEAPDVAETRPSAVQTPEPDMGAEQLARAPEGRRDPAPAPERLSGTITAARPDARGLLMVRLDNGQIWQQTEQPGVPISIREDGRQAVEISRSGFGGYRMYLKELGRTMVVKRVE